MNLWFNKEKMYTANDIAKRFEKIAPLELGLAGDELGFVHGDPETQVTGPANSISIPTANVRNCSISIALSFTGVTPIGMPLKTTGCRTRLSCPSESRTCTL